MPKPVILHIDDNPAFRETFAHVFGGVEVTVIGRRDGREAGSLVPGRDYHCLVFDSSGLDYASASAQQRRAAAVAAIALMAFPPPGARIADVVLTKSDTAWHIKVVDAVIARLSCQSTSRGSTQRPDVFAGLSPDQLDSYRGKVLLVAGHPEFVVGVATTLAEAERMAEESSYTKSGCRIVQGPSAQAMTLAELEGR